MVIVIVYTFDEFPKGFRSTCRIKNIIGDGLVVVNSGIAKGLFSFMPFGFIFSDMVRIVSAFF